MTFFKVFKLFYLFGLGFLFLHFFQTPALASVIFYDEFDDGDISDWVVVRNTCGDPYLVEGKVIFNVNTIGCFAELTPMEFSLGLNEDNYVYESDIYYLPGETDGKFVFRYKDPLNFYWVQIIHNGVYINKHVNGVGTEMTPSRPTFPSAPDNIYRFKIVYKTLETGRTISLYVNDNPVAIDVEDPPPYFSGSNIAMGVSTGADPILYTWFDNVLVCDSVSEP